MSELSQTVQQQCEAIRTELKTVSRSLSAVERISQNEFVTNKVHQRLSERLAKTLTTIQACIAELPIILHYQPNVEEQAESVLNDSL